MDRPRDTRELPLRLAPVLREVIHANAEKIADLASQRRIVVLVVDPSPSTKAALHEIGWNGSAPVFPLSSGARRRVASECLKGAGTWRETGDTVMHRWLTEPGTPDHARVFVFLDTGALLLNHKPGRGWYVEDELTDIERTQRTH